MAFCLMLVQWILPEWRANRQFVEHECRVKEVKIGEDPDRGDRPPLFRPEIGIFFHIDGQAYPVTTYDIGWAYDYTREQAEAICAQFEPGQTYRCWYDPSDPKRVVLVRGYSWWRWLILVLPGSFVAIGGAGLVHAALRTGASAERRSALARKAASLELFDQGDPRGAGFPTVPPQSHITDSPGTELAYRLPTDALPGLTLAAIASVCVVWNAIVAAMIVVAIAGFRSGHGDWFLTVFLLPFLVVGIGLIWRVVREIFATTGVGATRLEISAHPLYPGEEYRVLLSQAGRMKLHSLEVVLVSEEYASYRQGTDTRCETHRVVEELLFERRDFEIEPMASFEARCVVRIPETAMHSFQAPHNEIRWRIVVRGDVAHWPNFDRAFPIIVYPNLSRGARSRDAAAVLARS